MTVKMFFVEIKKGNDCMLIPFLTLEDAKVYASKLSKSTNEPHKFYKCAFCEPYNTLGYCIEIL